MSDRAPALVILGEGSLATARRVQAAFAGATIHGLAGRAAGADAAFEKFGAALRQLFQDDVPIVAFCAAGIVIRTLAPLMRDKRVEPPVIAVAADGSAVVPLLGGLRGVNDLARAIGSALGVAPAITTTGEVRFAATLESPPVGYELRDPGAGKRFMSDLLAGEKIRLVGNAPWLTQTRLPFDPKGRLSIVITPHETEPKERELVFHPRSVAVAVLGGHADLPRLVTEALARQTLSPQAVGAVIAAERDAADPDVHAVAVALGRPVRFVAVASPSPAGLVRAAVADPVEEPVVESALAIAVAASPLDANSIGRGRGRLAVVGLGPGANGWMAPDARRELASAEDIVGYQAYVRMAGPFRGDQVVHASDNREEMDRARQALGLAASGRSVAVVSSGDPGIFAMAAAVMEALHASTEPAWHGVELVVIPGISAAQAAAARAGAPLGHDFCVLSLSDNLKPWEAIERRLDHAAAADLALALYNPTSAARPCQLGRAIEIVRAHRKPATPVVLGRDIGRPGETIKIVTVATLSPADVDMRTVIIIGSSTTQVFPKLGGTTWAYTPRWYPTPDGQT